MLLDHFIGASDQPRRHREAKCFGGPEVDSEFEFCRQLHWELARLLPLYKAGDINAGTAVGILRTRAITNQAAGSSVLCEPPFSANRLYDRIMCLVSPAD
jgi:hypothetical protein